MILKALFCLFSCFLHFRSLYIDSCKLCMKSICKPRSRSNYLWAGFGSRDTYEHMFSGMVFHISHNISFFFRNTVHTIRCPSQCNLTQCRKFFSSEKMIQRPLRLLLLINFPFLHTLDQIFRLNIDHFHLIGMVKNAIRDSLPHLDMRDRPYKIVQTL